MAVAGKRKRLGEILIGWGLVDDKSMADAVSFAGTNRIRIGEALVKLHLATEDDVARALAEQFQLEYVDIDKTVILPAAIALVPEEIVRKYQIIPLAQEEKKLKLVMSDPNDLETLDMLRWRLNVEPVISLAAPSKIKKFVDKFLSGELSIDVALRETATSIDVSTDAAAVGGLKRESEAVDAPIIKLIHMIITEAVNTRASDIHIEPFANRVRVRFRVDGVCVEKDKIDKHLQNAVLSRVKLMSGMDIAEKRLPQDGRIKMRVGGTDIDFRVSSLPAYHGESMVLRILRPDSVKIGVQALGFEEDDYVKFQRVIKRPNGMFLVTGPTGSGKTTTLYAALQELNRPDRKLITAEDPVEYNFTGINQCQVKDQIGFTFQSILRSMLRQAPNIIMVGEIRDREVGEIAIQAALTGHLVFSTLHTNDAPSAITRLIDMGIKPFLVASSIMAVQAQRLIRTVCPDCTGPDHAPNRLYLRILGFRDVELEGKIINKAVGCKKCLNTGYRGRTGIHEIMLMNSEIRQLAFTRAPANVVRKAAIGSGMRNLVGSGKIKILRGMTTPEEVIKVAQAEQLIRVEEGEAA